MAVELTLSAYERNVKNFNKKGLRRQFYSIHTHQSEYVNNQQLALTNKFVFETTVDKESVEKFIELLKSEGFKVLGSENYFYLENLIEEYDLNQAKYSNINKEAIEAIRKDLKTMKEKAAEYKEIENDDCVFYFMPYNDGIDSLYEFVKTKKDVLLKFAKDNDITLMFKIMGYNSQIDGFFGFNFFDADNTKEEVVIDYASRISVIADFNNRNSVFSSGVLLAGIGETEEELVDPELNVHILGENVKYTK